LCTTLRDKLGFDVLAETGNGREALDLCRKLRPEMAIIDLGIPGLPGDQVAARLLEEMPGLRLLIISSSFRSEALFDLLQKGVHGFVHKTESFESLLLAIESVAANKLFVCAPLSTGNPETSSEDQLLLGRLSDREKEVLQGIAEGKTNKLLASDLGINIKTVEAHRTQLARKLGIHDIAGLTLFAARVGLVQP
jgi:DNA-binding NarL/FixJ family response regulator